MPGHLPAGRSGVCFYASERIALRTIMGQRHLADSDHEGLVTVISRPVVAIAKHPGHGDLRYFLAIAKNSKLSLAHEYLLAAQHAGLATFASKFKVCQHHFPFFKGGAGSHGFCLAHINEVWR